jgi:hypothetical protein
MEGSGYYFHLEPPILLLGGGMYVFSKPILARYRRAVADAGYGPELAAIVGKIARRPGFTINGSSYKRIPAGFDPTPEAAPRSSTTDFMPAGRGASPPSCTPPP